MNELYNFHEVCLLCEIIENCFELMHKICGFDSRRCNSVKALNGWIKKNLSLFIIVLPTDSEMIRIFEEKNLNGGFSCVNTRLKLNSEIILLNLLQSDFNKLKINKSFHAYKIQILK